MNPLKVAYDVSSLNHAQISGVGTYMVHLLEALRTHADLEMRPFYRLSRIKNRAVIQSHAGKARPWLPLMGIESELVHGPDFKVIPARGRKRVVTIHDLAFLHEGMTSPEFREKKKRDLESMLANTPPDHILSDSRATTEDLVRFYPQFNDRVTTVPLGGDHLWPKAQAANEKPENQFLFVGNLEARKNVLRIIQAFEKHAGRAATPTRLVLVGKPGYQGEEILKAAETSPVRERIDVIGYCSGEELRAHYRRSLALVYPSIIEGFGFPVIEAMMAGLPVITSGYTSTAEISGDTAWLVKPEDVGAIADALDAALDLAQKPEERRAWIERARTKAATFTWKSCADATAAVYRRVCSK